MPPARATLNVVSCSDVASLSSLLKLDVLDKDAMGRNQILGSAEFPVANLALHPKVHGAPRPLAPPISNGSRMFGVLAVGYVVPASRRRRARRRGDPSRF